MGDGWQAGISEREREVLAAVARYRTNAQIGRELSISVRTVESHVASLLRKFGVGDRRALADLVRPTVDGPPAESASVVGVPASRDSFVGREPVGEQVVAYLSEARLVSLLGPGGIGKSRLAVMVVESIGHRFSDGGAFVDLVGVGRGFVAQTVAAAFEVGELPLRSLADAVMGRIGDDKVLLVFDNCDHLIDEASELIGRLLAGCPRLTVLVTSRERLGVSGERTVQVPPLSLESEAVRLFTDRARSVDPEFVADPGTLAELCGRLDGVPLAIELAAARVGSLGVEGLREALDDRLRVLAGGRGTNPRHRSLRDVLAWGHDLLTDDERALFRRLGVFVGGFDIEAAVAVSQGIPRSAVIDLIGRLVDRSLLVYRPAGTGSRWRMLATVGAFATDQLNASGEKAVVRRSHLEWAAALAAGLEARLGSDWRDDFDAVAGDLRAALAATTSEPDGIAHRLARSTARLAFARGAFAESSRHHRAAAVRAGDPEAASRDLLSAAEAVTVLADGPTAYRLLLDAAQVAHDGGCRALRATALAKAVIVAHRFPATPYAATDRRASELLDEATAAAESDDPGLAALSATARAWSAGRGAVEPDLRLSEEAVEAADRTEDPVLRMGALDTLGAALALRGHLRDASRIARKRLEIAATLPRVRPDAVVEIVDAFHSASAAAVRIGQSADALAIARQARTADPVGDEPLFIAYKESLPLALTGRFEEAVARVEALWGALSRSDESPPPWLSPMVLAAALAHGLRGDHEAGLWWSRALEVAGVGGPEQSVHLAAVAAFVRARVAIHTGEPPEVSRLVAQCFAEYPVPRYRAYAEAAGAELATVAGLPDAPERVAQARASAAENAWAAACLQRTVGRGGDRSALLAAVDQWEAIDARFERACTLWLVPGRAAEARAEFEALGCPLPVSR